jgi:hypothetical protein
MIAPIGHQFASAMACPDKLEWLSSASLPEAAEGIRNICSGNTQASAVIFLFLDGSGVENNLNCQAQDVCVSSEHCGRLDLPEGSAVEIML